MDLNHQPPGPEPTHGSRENQCKALNRRRIDEQLSPLIGLLIGLQIVSPTLVGGKRGTRRPPLINRPVPPTTRAAEAALIPWIEFGPENVLEGEMQGKLNQARTAERALHDS